MKFPQNRFNSFLNGSSLKMPWEVPSHKFSKRADFYQGKFREFFGETTQKVYQTPLQFPEQKIRSSCHSYPQFLPQLRAVRPAGPPARSCGAKKDWAKSARPWVGYQLLKVVRCWCLQIGKNSGLVNIFHTLKKIWCFWTYTCMHAWVHVCIHKCWIYVYMYVDICVHIYVYNVHVCVHICVHMSVHICARICVLVFAHLCDVCVHMCVHICTCEWTCMHTMHTCVYIIHRSKNTQ